MSELMDQKKEKKEKQIRHERFITENETGVGLTVTIPATANKEQEEAIRQAFPKSYIKKESIEGEIDG
jgi:hypothetical protein